MAVGLSIPETCGVNRSGVHWDMACDLREGGEVLADGELFTKDGRVRGVGESSEGSGVDLMIVIIMITIIKLRSQSVYGSSHLFC